MDILPCFRAARFGYTFMQFTAMMARLSALCDGAHPNKASTLPARSCFAAEAIRTSSR
jgi:hypothetical protein